MVNKQGNQRAQNNLLKEAYSTDQNIDKEDHMKYKTKVPKTMTTECGSLALKEIYIN